MDKKEQNTGRPWLNYFEEWVWPCVINANHYQENPKLEILLNKDNWKEQIGGFLPSSQ